MSTKLHTPVFRVSFPSVFAKARAMEGGTSEPKYEITAIFEPSKFNAEEKKLWAAMMADANAKSMEKFKKPLDKLPSNFHRPHRPNEEKENFGGYVAGGVFAKLSSKLKPGVVAADGRTLLSDPESVYAGCYARATINSYAFDNKSKGVKWGLQNLQFVRDGARLDSRTNPEEDFGEAAVEDDLV